MTPPDEGPLPADARRRPTSRIATLLAAGVLALVPSTSSADDQPAADDWLGIVNAYRATADLPPLVEDAQLTHDAQLHADYMAQTGHAGHAQDPSRPEYTEAGHRAAQASVVTLYVHHEIASPRLIIDQWAQGPLHMATIIDPRLQTTGFGYATHLPGERWRTAGVLDVLHGREERPFGPPVLWPADGTVVPQTSYEGNEHPDPVGTCGYSAPTGLPALVLTGPHGAGLDSASITGPDGPLESCAYDATSYTNPDPAAQDYARLSLAERGVIVVVPRHPLELGSSYQLEVTTTDGQVLRSSYTTADRFAAPSSPQPQARDTRDTCSHGQAASFEDTDGNVHGDSIECIREHGVTSGYPDGTYRPRLSVSASQVATFLVRTMAAAGHDVGTDPGTCGDGAHAGNVARLVEAGIMTSCDAGHPATRSQMAAWTAGALEHFGGVAVQEAPDYFSDDDHLPAHAQAAHDAVAHLGIVTGTAQGDFAPHADLSRAQMATFLARALDAALAGG